MIIEELKKQIEDKNISSDLMIFKYKDSKFLVEQYIQHIARIKNVDITYVHDINSILQDSGSIFSNILDEYAPRLNVLYSEVYIWGKVDIAKLKDTIIVTTKFEDSDVEKYFSDSIVTFPQLEDWMIRDYVLSVLEGVPPQDTEKLISLCGSNIYRLENEIDKIRLFRADEQRYLFNSMLVDGALEDLSSYNIFNFTNALISKDVNSLKSIYKELNNVDVNEFGLLTILLKNFRNMILVQLSSNPTPENTGLDGRQLYAIKKIPKVFSNTDLVRVYEFLLELDSKIKQGELPTEFLIDYIIVNIMR